MLTADVVPSEGEAFNFGYSMNSEFLSAFELFGYCPQVNSLWENLTTREHLQLFSRIKGMNVRQSFSRCEQVGRFLNCVKFLVETDFV